MTFKGCHKIAYKLKEEIRAEFPLLVFDKVGHSKVTTLYKNLISSLKALLKLLELKK